LVIILLTIVWLLRPRSIGIEIADKFLGNFHGLHFRGQILNSRNFGTLPKIEEKFRREGAMGVLFGRHLLGLRTQIFLMAGVMRMSVTKFIIADPTTTLLALTVAFFWGESFF
jgi:membrane protein DedA with SNARE-associated domain